MISVGRAVRQLGVGADGEVDEATPLWRDEYVQSNGLTGVVGRGV